MAWKSSNLGCQGYDLCACGSIGATLIIKIKKDIFIKLKILNCLITSYTVNI